MKVRYFAHFIDDAGCSEETIEPCPPTLRDLVSEILKRHGDAFRHPLLDAEGKELHEEVFLLVDGRHMSRLQGLETRLAGDGTVAVIPVTEAG